jgi:hypothetical protein
MLCQWTTLFSWQWQPLSTEMQLFTKWPIFLQGGKRGAKPSEKHGSELLLRRKPTYESQYVCPSDRIRRSLTFTLNLSMTTVQLGGGSEPTIRISAPERERGEWPDHFSVEIAGAGITAVSRLRTLRTRQRWVATFEILQVLPSHGPTSGSGNRQRESFRFGPHVIPLDTCALSSISAPVSVHRTPSAPSRRSRLASARLGVSLTKLRRCWRMNNSECSARTVRFNLPFERTAYGVRSLSRSRRKRTSAV